MQFNCFGNGKQYTFNVPEHLAKSFLVANATHGFSFWQIYKAAPDFVKEKIKVATKVIYDRE